jgi:hypothetical protein
MFALTVAMLALAAAAYADDKPSPFYTLPADASWVAFDWTRTSRDNKEEKGTLTVRSVGVKDVDGVRCRWVEIAEEWKRGDAKKWQRRKLLVAEEALAEGKPLVDCVRDCFHQDDVNPNVVRLSAKHQREFLRLNMPVDLALKEIQANEEVMTGLGKLTARHMSAVVTEGTKRQEYHGWLTKDVPFGVAKFEIHEKSGDAAPRVLFTATANRSGKDAKSELDETKAK